MNQNIKQYVSYLLIIVGAVGFAYAYFAIPESAGIDKLVSLYETFYFMLMGAYVVLCVIVSAIAVISYPYNRRLENPALSRLIEAHSMRASVFTVLAMIFLFFVALTSEDNRFLKSTALVIPSVVLLMSGFVRLLNVKIKEKYE